MAIDYGLDKLDFRGLIQDMAHSQTKLVELDYQKTQEDNAKFEKLLTHEAWKGLMAKQSEAANKLWVDYNKTATQKFKTIEEVGGHLSPSDWAELNSQRDIIESDINRMQASTKASQEAVAKMATDPTKFHTRLTNEKLDEFIKDPVGYKGDNNFLVSNPKPLSDLMRKLESGYAFNAETQTDPKIKKGLKRQETISMRSGFYDVVNGKPTRLNENELNKRKFNVLYDNITSNQELLRSTTMAYSDLKNASPDIVSRIESDANALFPQDPVKQANARLSLTALALYPDLFSYKTKQDVDVYTPPAGKEGKEPKLKTPGEGVVTPTGFTSLASGRKYSDVQGTQKSIGGTAPDRQIQISVKGTTVPFEGQVHFIAEDGVAYVIGTSQKKTHTDFKTREEADALQQTQASMAEEFKGTKLTSKVDEVIVRDPKTNKKQTVYRTSFYQPVEDIAIPVADWNKISPNKLPLGSKVKESAFYSGKNKVSKTTKTTKKAVLSDPNPF